MSAYTKGVRNANSLFDAFVTDDLICGAVTMTTAQTLSAITHGLSGTPDFVLLSGRSSAAQGEGVGWTATATTLTLIKTDTNASTQYISYIAGNLA